MHPERAIHYSDSTKSKCRFIGWCSLPSTLLSCLPHAEPTRFFSPQDTAPLRHSRDPRTPCAPAYTHTTRSTHCVCPLTCTRPLSVSHTRARMQGDDDIRFHACSKAFTLDSRISVTSSEPASPFPGPILRYDTRSHYKSGLCRRADGENLRSPSQRAARTRQAL